MTGTAGQLRVPTSYLRQHISPRPLRRTAPHRRRHRTAVHPPRCWRRRAQRAQVALKRYRPPPESRRRGQPHRRLAHRASRRRASRDATGAHPRQRRARWEATPRQGQRPHEGHLRRTESARHASLPTLPGSWAWATVEQVVNIKAGKNYRACAERPPEEGEVGVVKVSAVTWQASITSLKRQDVY